MIANGFFHRLSAAVTLKVFSALLGLLSTLVITRGMNAENSGYLFLCLSLIAIFSSVFKTGLESIVVRRVAIATSFSEIKRIIVNSSSLVLFCAASTGVCVLIAAKIFPLSSGSAFQVVAGVIEHVLVIALIESIFLILMRLFQGLERSILFLALLVAQKLCFIIALFSYFYFFQKLNFISGSWLYASSFLLPFFIFLILVRQGFPNYVLPSNQPKCLDNTKGSLFRESWPIWISTISAVTVVHAGPVVIAGSMDADNVALFSVATRLASALALILVAANVILGPLFSKGYNVGGISEVYSQFKYYGIRIFALACPVFFSVILFANPLLSLFGEFYQQAEDILLIMCVGQLVNISSGSISVALIMSKNSLIYGKIQVAGAVASLLGYAFLVPIMGILGASVIYSGALIGVNLWGFYTLRKFAVLERIKDLETYEK